MNILNFGSLNIDLVYSVPHIAQPGETISSTQHCVFAGGKGANQSAALARAGAAVYHAGQVGQDGAWLVEKLQGLGVDMQWTQVTSEPTGHALIQVAESGENSIVLFPGANTTLQRPHIDRAIGHFKKGDILLLQNEINDIPYIIGQAAQRGMRIAFNPAPFHADILTYDLEQVEWLLLNETEAAGLLSATLMPDATLAALAQRYPHAHLVLTLGAGGVRLCSPEATYAVPARTVHAVDTTGAGDTFIGYFLAALTAGHDALTALQHGVHAAALCVTKSGAMDSIPTLEEVRKIL